MRWTEIVEHARLKGLRLPTYRRMDRWTRVDRLSSEIRGDHHGRYRWWPDAEVDAALLVAYLMDCGLDEDLSFRLARTAPDTSGARTVAIQFDGDGSPLVSVSVAGR